MSDLSSWLIVPVQRKGRKIGHVIHGDRFRFRAWPIEGTWVQDDHDSSATENSFTLDSGDLWRSVAHGQGVRSSLILPACLFSIQA